MKKYLTLFIAGVILILSSCATNSDIDNLQSQIDELKSGQIATIANQISSINGSISSLQEADREIKGYISVLQNTATELQKSINSADGKIDDMEKALVLVNTAIENLKAKDSALEQRITDLKDYVDTQLRGAKDWVSATFATLEQYNGIVSEIGGIKGSISSINTAMQQMESRLNGKITLMKGEIEEAYTKAIGSLESSLKNWVNEQLEGYWTIAETEGKLETLEGNLTQEDESIREDIGKLRSSLDSAKTELTEGYKAAIKKAIEENNGVLEGKLSEAVSGLNTRIDGEVSAINERIDAIEKRVTSLEVQVTALVSRIQSLSYIPRYIDGASTMWLKTLSDGSIEARDTLDFRVSPADCADELVKVWEKAVSAEAVSLMTRGTQETVTLPVVSVNGGDGKISVVLDGSSLSEEFYAGEQQMSVVVIISDGNNERTSEYVSMVAKEINSPLTFTSTGETSISLVKVGSPDDVSLEYRINGGGWTTYTVGDAIALADEEKISFRAGAGGNISFGKSSNNYHRFTVTGSGTIAASGSIMSLLNQEESLVIPSEYCFSGLFYSCNRLTTSPELPATTLANDCYLGLFIGCTRLTAASELPATTLAKDCYQSMFESCTSLTTAPELPATTLAVGCYARMFASCTRLTSAPELPATSLAERCYYDMFNCCTSLTTAPKLPATTLAEYCYSDMFSCCYSLPMSPKLPAKTLAKGCYQSMFASCTSLKTMPELPATTLAVGCYWAMFSGCTSLTTAPELPATTLADYCYLSMFHGCTSLTIAPELPATSLATNCYSGMFYGCGRLNYIKALFTTTPTDTYTKDWVSGVASTGTFVKSKDATWDVTGVNGVPEGWTVIPPTEPTYEMLAQWHFCVVEADVLCAHFAEAAKINGATNAAACQPGFGEDLYCAANESGNGKIMFYNATDKTDINPKGRCKRGIGNSGEPYWYGAWLGDYIWFEATPTAPLAAGTTLNIWFTLRPNSANTLKYWLLEINDGGTWVPVGDVKTATVNGVDVKYNIELKFDPSGAGTPESPKQFNSEVDRNYTLTKAVDKVEYKVTCQSLMIADGTKVVTYIGESSANKDENSIVRICGEDSAGGGSTPVTHHTWIAIVK
jgi:predicted  nucleic acid-binding Zn-ribbon protein